MTRAKRLMTGSFDGAETRAGDSLCCLRTMKTAILCVVLIIGFSISGLTVACGVKMTNADHRKPLCLFGSDALRRINGLWNESIKMLQDGSEWSHQIEGVRNKILSFCVEELTYSPGEVSMSIPHTYFYGRRLAWHLIIRVTLLQGVLLNSKAPMHPDHFYHEHLDSASPIIRKLKQSEFKKWIEEGLNKVLPVIDGNKKIESNRKGWIQAISAIDRPV